LPPPRPRRSPTRSLGSAFISSACSPARRRARRSLSSVRCASRLSSLPRPGYRRCAAATLRSRTRFAHTSPQCRRPGSHRPHRSNTWPHSGRRGQDGACAACPASRVTRPAQRRGS
jgi:hypothetical protein